MSGRAYHVCMDHLNDVTPAGQLSLLGRDGSPDQPGSSFECRVCSGRYTEFFDDQTPEVNPSMVRDQNGRRLP
jgi:hypothetical protein